MRAAKACTGGVWGQQLRRVLVGPLAMRVGNGSFKAVRYMSTRSTCPSLASSAAPRWFGSGRYPPSTARSQRCWESDLCIRASMSAPRPLSPEHAPEDSVESSAHGQFHNSHGTATTTFEPRRARTRMQCARTPSPQETGTGPHRGPPCSCQASFGTQAGVPASLNASLGTLSPRQRRADR
jgi:hypothetical protein